MSGAIQNIVVYLSSSGHVTDDILQASADLGHKIAQKGYGLIFGGMDLGPMGALANAALHEKGVVTGIVPQKLRESAFIHNALTKSIVVDTLAERKRMMFELSDAVIVLPGGFGTLDEVADILYWAALGFHNKPIIFVNIRGFWDDVLCLYDRLFSNQPNIKALIKWSSSPHEALNILEQFPEKTKLISPLSEPLPCFEDDILSSPDPLIVNEQNIRSLTTVIAGLLCKQLNLTSRAIGVVNKDSFYDPLFNYIDRAYQENFITRDCLLLLNQAKSPEELTVVLQSHKHTKIDLAKKWGKSETRQ